MLFAQAVSTTVHKTAAAACGASVNHSQTRKEKRHGKRRKCFGNHRPQSILRCTSRKNRKDIHPIRYRVDDRLVLRARFLPHSRASDRKSRILLRSVSSRIRLRCAFHSPVYKLVQKYPIAVFLLSIPVTGILEYFTGLVMFRIWHARWWDYTTAFLNIGGFVCLRSVLSFGVGALILIYIVDPAVSGITGKLSPRMRNAVSALLLALLIFDIIMTVLFRMPKPFA